MNTKGKLKRLIAVAIAGIMVLSLFAGCSKEETTSGTGGDGELPEVELVYYTLGTWPLPDQDAVFAEFNKMLKEKINATVDFRVFDTGSYDQKMQTVIGSGGYYDFCYTSNWSNNFISNVSKGAFLPLDDLLTEYAPNLYASMPEEIWDSVRIDGKIMAAINQQVYASCPAVYLRKHVLEESGYDWQTQYKKGDLRSLEPLIKYIHDNYEKSFFWADYVSTPLIGYEYLGGALPAALDLQGDGKTIVNPFKEDRFKDTVKILQDYNSKGYTASEIRSAYASDPIPFGQMGTSEDGYLAITGTYMPGYDAIIRKKIKNGRPDGRPLTRSFRPTTCMQPCWVSTLPLRTRSAP